MDEELPDGVKRLPIRFKSPLPPERTLLFPYEVEKPERCSHENFIVDNKKAEVECGQCHEKLNPMWVLTVLTDRDHRYHESHSRYQEEMKRLEDRVRTKCQHCDKMTRISRR